MPLSPGALIPVIAQELDAEEVISSTNRRSGEGFRIPAASKYWERLKVGGPVTYDPENRSILLQKAEVGPPIRIMYLGAVAERPIPLSPSRGDLSRAPPAICRQDHQTCELVIKDTSARSGVERVARQRVDSNGEDPSVGQEGTRFDQTVIEIGPALTPVDALEDTLAICARIDRGWRRRIDGQSKNAGVGQAVDGRPALTAVDALEDALAVRARVEGSRSRRIYGQNGDNGRKTGNAPACVDRCPGLAAVEALEDTLAICARIDRGWRRRIDGQSKNAGVSQAVDGRPALTAVDALEDALALPAT